MDATTTSVAASAKKMNRGAEKKKPSSSSSSSWVARSMGFYYPPSTSSKSRTQPAPAAAKDSKNGNSNGSSKKKRSISIGRSMTCAGSICSTKESSVMSDRGAGRSASSRSLRAPDVDVIVDAVYASTAAAISATSSFNSDTTTAATTVTTSSSSPLSSVGSSFRGVQQIRKLSSCYECHSVFEPRSFAAAAAAFPCADCDEVFAKAESLELHRATRHVGIYLVLEIQKQNGIFNLKCSNFSHS